MSEQKPARASLVAAARAQSTTTGAGAGAGEASSRPVSEAASARSTPTASESPAVVVTKMKFKPKVPIRKKQDPDVKPEISTASSVPARGALRGRGRGGAQRGRGGPLQSIAAGPFGGRSAAASSSRRIAPLSAPSRNHDPVDAEVYSDDEQDPGRRDIIDIDAVSGLSESAPTSLYRDRRATDAKAKGKAKAKAGRGKARQDAILSGMDIDSDVDLPVRVKAEPISPDKALQALPPVALDREDDTMLSDDEVQDRDQSGRRVRAFARGRDVDEGSDDDVNEAQKLDLSESEEEEEEEDMQGDFVQEDGNDDPSDKLYMFQFPNLFPSFSPRVIDATGPDGDTKPDIKPDLKADTKPTAAQLRGKKGAVAPPPEGRIGTLCVMKSGRVKMVLGDGIVMNVTPGVATSFIQQIVHMDSQKKQTNVLGEIHKSYVVTPDMDRLLGELFASGGMTPGDRERERRRQIMLAQRDGGLVKMEID